MTVISGMGEKWVFKGHTSFGTNAKMAKEHARIQYPSLKGKKIMVKRQSNKKEKVTGFYDYYVYVKPEVK